MLGNALKVLLSRKRIKKVGMINNVWNQTHIASVSHVYQSVLFNESDGLAVTAVCPK